ncbi:MAG: prepilin-type N-terminal cleavage/methylation domain-containing protein [Akkermansiaceae bacterium]|nr:prepilin-type N-terminal cleavage/methylation domain-containing protein [Akkermansiaceae bacterium]
MNFPGLTQRRIFRLRTAFSLVEMIVVVAIVGILGMLAVPTISNVWDSSHKAAAQRNAQNIACISSELASMGVAHVLPDSLGGVEATARLLREGVTVNRGIFSGQLITIRGISDDEITKASEYLEIVYDLNEIRLVYLGPTEV